MNPEDAMPDAAKETIDQANAVEKQMTAEATAAAEANAEPAGDNSILADDADSNYKPLSEIAAAKPDAPSVDPTVLVNESTQPTTTAEPKKTKNKRVPIIIGLLAAVVLLVGLGVWALVAFLSHDSGGAVAEDGKIAFAIESDKHDGSFAIFDNDGNRLTDFIYGEVSEFKNGYAVVQDSSRTKFAIITNNGKLSVPFGKYDNIELVGSLFSVKKDDELFLLNGKGEEIMPIIKSDSANGLTIAYSDNIAMVFDGNGEKLGEVESNVSISKKVEKGYATVKIGNTTYLINASDGTVKNKFESKSEEYSIDDVSKDGDIVILSSATNQKIFWGDKMYDWDRAKYSYAMINSGYYVHSYNKDDRYFMGGNGKIFQGPSISSTFVIFDEKHYAYLPFSSTTIHIIVGDETIEINNISSLERTSDGYSISYSDYSSGTIISKNDGKTIFDESLLKSKTIRRINGPDPNGLFIANYSVLLNKNLKEIASTNVTLKYLDGNYLASKFDSKGIVSPEGKTIIDPALCKEIESIDDFYLCTVGNKNFNLYTRSGRRILEGYESIKITNGHIEADNGEKTEYYTLNGDKFYEA